jgi:two-component system response regulator CpxR
MPSSAAIHDLQKWKFFSIAQMPNIFRATLQRARQPVGCALFLLALLIQKIWKFRAPAPAQVAALGAAPIASSERAMKPKRTILCVDDNEQSLSIRKVMLETRGYRVIVCNNGLDALEHFKLGGIDLVLSDLIMPGLDGHRLIEEIKKLSPQTPAILFSGKVKIYERNLHADVFLPKGMYAPVELLERIRLLLVRKRGPKRIMPFSMTTGGQAGVAAS